MFYTYIVECSNGTLYTGWTNDIDARLKRHNDGTASKYTRAHLPVALAACWEFGSKSEAMKFEWEIKQLPRPEKINLIKQRQMESARSRR